jgi:hypothetical protein
MPAFRYQINTVIQGESTSFDNLEEAVRFWDRTTLGSAPPAGDGLQVQEFRRDPDGEVMTRDGWLVHVETTGAIYINPNWV